MFGRDCLKVLGLICLVVPFTGCTNTQVGYIQVSPTTDALTVGQTVQLDATGTVGHGSHPSSTEDVTGQVSWSSSTPSVAKVTNPGGLVTAVGAGTATISASYPGTNGATVSITVTGTGGTTGGGTIVSLAVIPSAQTVSSPLQTTQFLAIATTSSGATEDITSQVTWSSSSKQIATITAGGLATAQSQGTATITAIVNTGNSTVVTGTGMFTVTGGTSEAITALAVTPSNQSVSASGQQAQFIAIGTVGSSGLQKDVTSVPGIQWSSSIPTIAKVDANTGVVTGVSAGTSTITAIWTNTDGSVASGTATVTATATAAPEPLLALQIIPNAITVGNLEDTGNFLAIGTYSVSPFVRDLTNSVTWLSSEPDVFPVNSNSNPVNPGAPGGVVTAFGTGSAVIIAEATDPNTGSIQTATAQFNCPLVLPTATTAGSCYPGSEAPGLKVTLTVYNEGLNTTNWLVTAPSATGTADVIHCGPGWNADGNTGGSVCTAAYPLGTKVTITAPAQPGVAFGGWSWTCTPTAPINAAGPNSCTVSLATSPDGVYSSNMTVGAIFNNSN